MLPPFVRQVTETLGIRIIAVLVGLLTAIVVTRGLGPEGRGLFAVALTLAGLGTQLGNLGLHASNTFYVAKSPHLLPQLMGNSLVAALAIGGGGSLAGWLCFSLLPGFTPLPNPILALAFLGIPFGLLNLYSLNLLLGSGDVRAYNGLELGAKLLTLGLIGSVAFAGMASPSVFVGASITATLIITGWGWLRLVEKSGGRLVWDHTLYRQHLPYGMKAYAAALLSFAALKSDLFLVNHLNGAHEAGLYATVLSLSEFVLIAPTLIGTLLFPRLAALHDTRHMWRHTRRALLGVGSLLLVLLSALALCSEALIHLLFGTAFGPAAQAIPWHLPGLLFLGLQIVLAQFLAATGLPWTLSLIWGLAWLFNLALNAVLIPNMGFPGASLTFSCTQLGMVLGSSVLIFRQLKRDHPHAD